MKKIKKYIPVYFKILSVFGLTVSTFLIVFIFLLGSMGTIQKRYNSLLDNLYNADAVLASFQQLYNQYNLYNTQNKPEPAEKALAELIVFNGLVAEIDAATEATTNSEIEAKNRRNILFEDVNKAMDLLVQGRENQDANAKGAGFLLLKDTQIPLQSQMATFKNIEMAKVNALQADINHSYQLVTMIVIGVMIVGTLLSGFMVFSVVGKISKGLGSLKRSADEIAKGNLGNQGILIQSQDELQLLSISFSKMQESLKGIVTSQSETSNEIMTMAEDLLISVTENGQASEVVVDAVVSMTDKMKLQEVEMRKTQEQIISVTEFLSEIEALTTKAKDESVRSLETAEDGTRIIATFVNNMQDVKSLVQEAMKAVNDLLIVSSEMNGILESMSGISRQTTLLALNASIEAARAGVEGRSFAVVASEIRKLAENSGGLGNDIGEMVRNTQSILEQINQAMENVGVGLKRGDVLSRDVATRFEDIKRINLEVDTSNQSIDKRIEQLAILFEGIGQAATETYEMVRENEHYSEDISASVEEQVANFEEIKDSVKHLNALSLVLKDQIKNFEV